MTNHLASIATLGELLTDLEKVRIMNLNRIGALEREYGTADPGLIAIAEALRGLEHQAELNLKRAWRKHPLAPWAKSVHGLGEKSIARLITILGDPYVATPHFWQDGVLMQAEPYERTPSQLWAYCGLGEPLRRRAKGMSQDELFQCGNPIAKKQLWLIANAFVKATRGPYNDLYYARKEATAERTHIRPCAPCHAKAGDPWKPGHRHADALRIVAKAFLLDLWGQARELHAAGVPA